MCGKSGFSKTKAAGSANQPCPLAVNPKLVEIKVVSHAKNDKGNEWKTYISTKDDVIIKATTTPNDETAWKQINWTGGEAVSGSLNERKISLSKAKLHNITAELGGNKSEVVVSVCELPALEIAEITFENNEVINRDTLSNYTKPEWKKGRAADKQSPICYARKSVVKLNAKFKVVIKPTEAESVKIKGSSKFEGTPLEWSIDVTVNPGDTEVVASALVSSKKLLDHVGAYENQLIAWETTPMNPKSPGTGNSQHTFYVTLSKPTTSPVYLTLLDVSCRAAQGKKSESDVISKIFSPFSAKNVVRKSDGKKLAYWNPDTTTATDTTLLLKASDGSGQCGSWAEFLIDMYKVQGINKGHKVYIGESIPAASTGFLVKNWKFANPPVSKPDAFTHTMGTDCKTRPPNGIAGQGNPNPPPAFFNHFIVVVGTDFYDPSYGAGPFASKTDWEAAAIDGLFKSGKTGFDKSKRTTMPDLLKFYDLESSTII